MNEIFDIDKSVSQLPLPNDGKKRPQYEQVSCQKANTADAFPLGVQSYKWTVSDSTWWIPSKSHFVMRITLSDDADGLLEDVGAPTMGLLSCLFQAIEFKIGGKTIQRISNFIPQIDSLIHRTTKSKPYLDSMAQADNFWTENWSIRHQEVVAEAANSSGRNATEFDLIYTPPLMLFHEYDGALPAGEYSLELTPQNESQYKFGLVEAEEYTNLAGIPKPDVAGGYKFQVNRLEFQLCTIEGPRMDSGTFVLPVTNIECQSSKLNTNSLSQKYFNVNSKTKALVVAYQDTRLSNGNVSRTKYCVARTDTNRAEYVSDNLANRLERLYVQFDGVSRPQPDADPKFTVDSVNRFTQRYRETLEECGLAQDPAGAETLAEWQRRGPYYYFNWNRNLQSGATRVQVNQQFNNQDDIVNSNVLLFSISEHAAKVTVSNGNVVSVDMSA